MKKAIMCKCYRASVFPVTNNLHAITVTFCTPINVVKNFKFPRIFMLLSSHYSRSLSVFKLPIVVWKFICTFFAPLFIPPNSSKHSKACYFWRCYGAGSNRYLAILLGIITEPQIIQASWWPCQCSSVFQNRMFLRKSLDLLLL